MPKLAIIATIEIAPGRRDELLPLLQAHRARCLKDEPGTVQFDVLLPHEGDTRVMIVCAKRQRE
jgi:(4S)-4-hydroxy-5-phosphonooxypentane-2,3-dione isomerase